MTFTIIILVAAVLVTAVIAWILHRASVAKQIAGFSSRIDLQLNSIQQLEREKDQLTAQKSELLVKLTRAEEKNNNLNSFHEKQKEEVEMIGQRFQSEFRNLAQGILEEKSQKFTQLNEEKIKAILDPLKSDIGQFKKKVEETYDKESKERFSLEKQVTRLIEMSVVMSQETNNLTTALKGNVKMQGNWGELILESLLENSGLTKNREYFIQEFIRDNAGNVIKDENGKGLQPDVTICYPDQRKVIIDSKVSLVAWDAFIATVSAEEQEQCMLDHIKSLRQHIDGLAKKNYPKYASALDYVLLFVPIEPAFLEAVKTDPSLWKYAYDKKILLVSPTNLFAVLKIIADLWKVEQQNKNAIEIADKAGAMYDKFVLFVENMEAVGKKLNDATESYDSAFKQLSTGRGNLVGRIEELKKMGANASKQLPERILYELNGSEVKN